jgi:hypothetical protein
MAESQSLLYSHPTHSYVLSRLASKVPIFIGKSSGHFTLFVKRSAPLLFSYKLLRVSSTVTNTHSSSSLVSMVLQVSTYLFKAYKFIPLIPSAGGAQLGEALRPELLACLGK